MRQFRAPAIRPPSGKPALLCPSTGLQFDYPASRLFSTLMPLDCLDAHACGGNLRHLRAIFDDLAVDAICAIDVLMPLPAAQTTACRRKFCGPCERGGRRASVRSFVMSSCWTTKTWRRPPPPTGRLCWRWIHKRKTIQAKSRQVDGPGNRRQPHQRCHFDPCRVRLALVFAHGWSERRPVKARPTRCLVVILVPSARLKASSLQPCSRETRQCDGGSASKFTNPHRPSLDPPHNINAFSAGRGQLVEMKPLQEVKQRDAVSLPQLAFPLPETWDDFTIT
jgi:hypothetical protein